MARIPHCEQAIIELSKLTGYLLNHRHPRGEAKAKFLERFGFRADAWELLHAALLAHAVENDITALHKTRFGMKFEVDGRAPIVRVVWAIATGACAPVRDAGPEKD